MYINIYKDLPHAGHLSRIAVSDIQIVNIGWPIKLTKLSCIQYPLVKKKLKIKIHLTLKLYSSQFNFI